MTGARAKGMNEKKATKIFDLMEVLRRLRLQQVALDGLRVPGLPDRVPEGELPVALRGRAADHRVAEHRQAGDLPRRVPRARGARAVAGHQHQPVALLRRAGPRRALRSGGLEGPGRNRRRGARRRTNRARRPDRVPPSTVRRAGPADRQQAGLRGAGEVGRLRRAGRAAGRHAATRSAGAPLRVDRFRVRARQPNPAGSDLGQADLFNAGGDGGGAAAPSAALPVVPAWSEVDQLNFEKESLGLYWSGHPVDRYAADLGDLRREDHGRAGAEEGRGAGRRGRRRRAARGPVARRQGRGRVGGRHRGRRPRAEDAQGRPDVRVHAGRRARERRGGGVPRDVQAVGAPGRERPDGGRDRQAGARRRDGPDPGGRGGLDRTC